MSKLLNNIHKMNNAELIGLSKNRWLPTDIQCAIAKTGYNRAQWYLAKNEGLSSEARDYMWSDECNRGYSLKTTLLSHGHYVNDPDKYWELYERYPRAWNRSPYRMVYAFFGSPYYLYKRLQVQSGTPSDLLNEIYDKRYANTLNVPEGALMNYNTKYELRTLAKHSNVDLPLAIKLSQCGLEEVQKLGFQKIVELS